MVWIGDLHPEVMTVNTVFGYNEVIPKSLDFIRDATPLPGWMNGMCSYSIWWLLIQRDWYYYQGDLAYLKEQKDYLTGLLRLLISQKKKKSRYDGVEKLDGGGRFLDWPSSENPVAIDAGLQALMLQAMKAGNELCKVLGEDGLAAECEAGEGCRMTPKAASKVIKPFLKSGVAPDAPGSKQAASLLALAGLMKPKEPIGIYLLQLMEGMDSLLFMVIICFERWLLPAIIKGDRRYANSGVRCSICATSFLEDFKL